MMRPASSVPSRTASATDEEFKPIRRTRTAGWRCLKSWIRSESRWYGALPNVPKDSVPPTSSATSRTDARAASASASTRSACGRSRRPASVSCSPRPPRANSGDPSSASSLRIWSDSDGCARCSDSAAAENDPCSTAARKYCSCCRVTEASSGKRGGGRPPGAGRPQESTAAAGGSGRHHGGGGVLVPNPAIPRREPPVTPAGEGRSAWRTALEAGAALLQDMTPLKDFDIYVAGLHCARHDGGMQMEAHHFCRQVNQDLLQCVIFDGNTKDANLIGIEYFVSERLFTTLPEDEQPSWHPHNYEVLSGQLVAPGLPEVAERALMKELMNSYGKTWHTWHTGRHDGEAGDRLPLRPPMLM